MAIAMSWSEAKDAGKRAFSEGNYPEALECYIAAIDQLVASDGREGSNNGSGSSHTSEHQILLSNVIACRLKIGGQDMAEKAVDDAKKCIALDDKWPKAHVRLASAYIALGGHSNDACLSLQRALSLDRNNKVAREMLVKEMRQRNTRERTGDDGSSSDGRQETGSSGPQPSSNPAEGNSQYHPTEETPRQHYPNASAPPQPSQSRNGSNHDGIEVDDIEPPNDYSSLSISQRIQHYFAQLVTWYHSQSDDIQTLIKVASCFLVLYILLGGRFGLDYALGGGKDIRRGNYGEGNAYERYSSSSSRRASSTGDRYSSGSDRYRDPYGDGTDSSTHRRQRAGDNYDAYDTRHQANSGYNDRTNSQNDRYYSRYGNNDNYYEPRGQRPSTSYRMPNLYDGSLISMAIMLGIWFICNRLGVNPMQALMMINLMQGRGQRRMGRWGYGAYPGGMGMGGGGFGFGRRRYGMGRRGRAW